MTGTPSAGPSDSSGRGPGCSALAMSTVESGFGAVCAHAAPATATAASPASAKRRDSRVSKIECCITINALPAPFVEDQRDIGAFPRTRQDERHAKKFGLTLRIGGQRFASLE